MCPEWPSFTAAEIAAFAGKPYAEVAAAVVGKFVGDDIPPGDLLEMCEEAYATFAHTAVVPVKQLTANRFLLELFHGPTLAFKDVAMQLLGRLYDYVLERQSRKMTIICATSGDTGGAAVEAFRGRKNARIVALFPEGRISEVQRRFMTTAVDANVACISVLGSFDDCQAIVKQAFQDDQFRHAVDLSGVNSINWARIAAQSVYYFTSGRGAGRAEREVAFVVPTGNFGDAYAAFVAKKLGLPIHSVTAATNSNDILARAIETGRYSRGAVAATQSPAMDIQVASNFERLYFEAVRRDGTETGRAFRAFADTGLLDIPPGAFAWMRELFRGASVSEADTAKTMLADAERDRRGHRPAHRRRPGRRAAWPGDAVGPGGGAVDRPPGQVPRGGPGGHGPVCPAPPRATPDLSKKPEKFERLPADGSSVKAFVRAFAANT
jgi:threonine synthase